MTAATGGAIAGAAGLSMSTVAGGAVAGASGAVFGSPLQGIGNAAYFGDAYGGGQFLTDIVAGGILGGVAGGVSGWLKNVKNVRNGGQPGDIWGFKSAGSKGASVTFDAPEPTGAWGPDGKPLKEFAGYKFGGMEYLDEGVRSTPQPFAGGVKTSFKSFNSLDDLGQLFKSKSLTNVSDDLVNSGWKKLDGNWGTRTVFEKQIGNQRYYAQWEVNAVHSTTNQPIGYWKLTYGKINATSINTIRVSPTSNFKP